MFTNKKSIIFITKSKIKITSVTLSGKPRENIIAESDWNFDNLLNFILKHKKTIGNSARLLLSEDFVYVITLSFTPEVIINRNIIKEKAQEFIPEDLNETIWDFKEVSNKKILVAAAVRNLFENLSELIIKSGIHIETIDPLSFSFARLTKRKEDPFLFVYLYDKAYMTLTHREAVLATERLELPINKDKVRKFILFTKENFQIYPKKIVFCGNIESLNLKEYEKERFLVEIQKLSPTISLAYKEDVKNKDEKVLNLQLVRNFSSSLSPSSKSSKKISVKKNKFPIFWIIAIFLVIVVIVVEVFMYFKFDFKLRLK